MSSSPAPPPAPVDAKPAKEQPDRSGYATMSARTLKRLEDAKTELVKRIRDKANDAPALLDDEPEYPADASDAARKRLKTSHNKLLDARFEKLSDEHVTEPAMKDLRAFASALGVRVKAVKVDAKEHDDKSKRKSPLKLAHVLITAKSVASLEARDRGGAEDDEETDLGARVAAPASAGDVDAVVKGVVAQIEKEQACVA